MTAIPFIGGQIAPLFLHSGDQMLWNLRRGSTYVQDKIREQQTLTSQVKPFMSGYKKNNKQTNPSKE